VAFTAQSDNAAHLGAVYDLSRQFGFQFTTSVAQNSEFYFATEDNQRVAPSALEHELRYVIRKELLSLSPKRWLRAYFYAGVVRYNTRGERLLGCRAGRDSFFMDPAGKIYPCLTLNREIGDITETPFDEIWRSERARRVRGAVDACREPCWMICTARASMLRNPFRPAAWIMRSWGKIAVGKGGSLTQ
jgi:MoaA/NifB/PqqE/SkfB family radical SAM enzyme